MAAAVSLGIGMGSVSHTVKASAAQAFQKFIDFQAWKDFMPESFRPIRGPARPLQSGDRLRMRLDTGLAKIPVPVDVFKVESPRAISWGGGSALLHADHRFVFEDRGEKTPCASCGITPWPWSRFQSSPALRRNRDWTDERYHTET